MAKSSQKEIETNRMRCWKNILRLARALFFEAFKRQQAEKQAVKVKEGRKQQKKKTTSISPNEVCRVAPTHKKNLCEKNYPYL